MQINIKQATLEDVQKVAVLAIKMWKSHTMEELKQEFYNYISKEKGAVFLAIEDEYPVGFAQYATYYRAGL